MLHNSKTPVDVVVMHRYLIHASFVRRPSHNGKDFGSIEKPASRQLRQRQRLKEIIEQTMGPPLLLFSSRSVQRLSLVLLFALPGVETGEAEIASRICKGLSEHHHLSIMTMLGCFGEYQQGLLSLLNSSLFSASVSPSAIP